MTKIKSVRWANGKGRFIAPSSYGVGSAAGFWVLASIMILALDYRSLEGGSKLYAYASSAASLFFLMVALLLRFGAVARSRMVILGAGLLLVSVLNAYLLGNESARFAGLFMPIVLLIAAMAGAYAAASAGLQLRTALGVILAASFINGAWQWYYSTAYRFVDIDEMRYQIVPVGVGFVMSVSVSRLLFSARFSLVMSLLLAFSAGLIAISVTRTLLVAVVANVFAALLWSFVYERNSVGVRSRMFVRLVCSIAILVFVALPLVRVVRPDVMLRWFERLSGLGGGELDYTGGIRLAQIQGMATELGANPIRWLLGEGFGGVYVLDMDFYSKYFGSIPDSSMIDRLMFGSIFADTTWMSLIFQGGLVFVCFLCLLFRKIYIYTAYAGRSADVLVRQDGRDLFIIIFSLIAASFSSNIFMGRLSNVMFGVLCGIVLYEISRSGNGLVIDRFKMTSRKPSHAVGASLL